MNNPGAIIQLPPPILVGAELTHKQSDKGQIANEFAPTKAGLTLAAFSWIIFLYGDNLTFTNLFDLKYSWLF